MQIKNLYHNKYLKYKNKYLNLQNQLGGAISLVKKPKFFSMYAGKLLAVETSTPT